MSDCLCGGDVFHLGKRGIQKRTARCGEDEGLYAVFGKGRGGGRQAVFKIIRRKGLEHGVVFAVHRQHARAALPCGFRKQAA